MKKCLNESKTIKILLLTFVMTAAVSFGIVQIIASSTPAPGSNQDPLVTKSYVDMKISEAISALSGSTGQTTTYYGSTSELEASIAELENRLKILERDYQYTSISVSAEIEKSKFSVLQLFAGQKLLLGEGTEMILRSGTVNAISGPGGDLSDLTSGLNIADGSKLEINHLIISSREDGRGVSVISSSVWILIKGSFSVQN